jgi:hypothetical protein
LYTVISAARNLGFQSDTKFRKPGGHLVGDQFEGDAVVLLAAQVRGQFRQRQQRPGAAHALVDDQRLDDVVDVGAGVGLPPGDLLGLAGDQRGRLAALACLDQRGELVEVVDRVHAALRGVPAGQVRLRFGGGQDGADAGVLLSGRRVGVGVVVATRPGRRGNVGNR